MESKGKQSYSYVNYTYRHVGVRVSAVYSILSILLNIVAGQQVIPIQA